MASFTEGLVLFPEFLCVCMNTQATISLGLPMKQTGLYILKHTHGQLGKVATSEQGFQIPGPRAGCATH